MAFRPKEVLFSPTADCNLSCTHCVTPKTREKLPLNIAGSFLLQCRRAGIKRVSFTGGEPFLAPEFLCKIASIAVKEGLLFGRIMTNAVWYKNRGELKIILERLRDSGYDGDICVSVDAFHKQSANKLATFIKTAVSVWRRPDIVSIAWVGGSREIETKKKIRKLLTSLKGLPIRMTKIQLSPVGSASRLENAWGNKWFKEDYCKGPGNVLFITPSGDVKPCCGYANDLNGLTIGNIKKDPVLRMIRTGNKSGFVSAIFTKGLSTMRKRLENIGIIFPGKTNNHCFFCYHLLTKVPKRALAKVTRGIGVAALILALSGYIIQPSHAGTEVMKKSKDYHGIKAKTVGLIPLPKWYHEGVLLDGDSIWVANGRQGNIWAIDKASGRVVSEIASPSGFTEAIVKTGENSYMVTDWEDKKLYEASLKNGKLSITKTLFNFAPSHPAGLVLAGNRLFAITWTRGLGTRFDMIELGDKFNIVRRVRIKDIQEPAHMAWDGSNLWITGWYNRRIYKVNPDDWTIKASFRAPLNKVTGIGWDGKHLWVTGTYADLYQLSVD